MALDLVVQKVTFNGGEAGFIMADVQSKELVAKLPNGRIMRLRGTMIRNLKHHNKAMALLTEVWKNQTLIPTFEGFLDAMKEEIGHVETYILLDGSIKKKPKSISFGAMDQVDFEQFYNRMVEVILTKVLPGVDRAELEQRIFDILGEPGPQQLERSQ